MTKSIFALTRLALVPALALAGLVVTSAPASAHLKVMPTSAKPGVTARLDFSFKSELPKVKTTRVELILPVEEVPEMRATGLAPKGWTMTKKKVTFPRPQTVDGKVYKEGVGSLVWTVDDKKGGIAPDKVGSFLVDVKMPERQGKVVFKGVQTYSDGRQVRWNDVSGHAAGDPAQPAAVFTISEDATISVDAGHGAHGGATPAPSAGATAPVSGAPAPAAPADAPGEVTASGPMALVSDMDWRKGLPWPVAGALALLLVIIGAVTMLMRRRSDSPNV